jgi:hypothetical protein
MTEPNIPTLHHLKRQRAEILALAARYQAYDVRVFGSVARGEATIHSDIGLLVRFKAGATMWDGVNLWQALQQYFGRSVSLVGDDGRDTRFMRRIREDVIPL